MTRGAPGHILEVGGDSWFSNTPKAVSCTGVRIFGPLIPTLVEYRP